jgi:hypothetical protein
LGRGRAASRRAGLARLAGGQPDRFPDYDVLDQADAWDDVTAGAVLGRLAPPPPLRFFSPAEERVARPLLDRLLAQESEPRVPVLEVVDARLAEEEIDGWHYDDMPEDGEVWRRSLAALAGDAVDPDSGPGRPFDQLTIGEQNTLLEAVRSHQGAWHGLPAARVWSLWLRYACTAFYAHPMAWNEIGFGGPAYPRGYKNAGLDKRESWEVRESDAHDPVPWAARVEAARARHR